jgi:hypothetical protein
MPLDRRRLMGLGAAAVVSVAAAACRGPVHDTGSAGPTAAPRPPTRTRSAEPTTGADRRPAFAGQPPPGHVYFGASIPDSRSVVAWETSLGASLALHRSYFTPDSNESAQLVDRCRDDLAHDRLPHVSTKAPVSWGQVAAGEADDWLSDLFRRLSALEAPVFFTLHHEPENDVGAPGMEHGDFVAMQRRAIRLGAELAPDVTVVPILQHWTFEPLRRGDVDPRRWIVPEATVHGVDVYNPWSPTNGKEWRSFGSRADEVRAWIEHTPLAIGEYGCREDPSNPGLAGQWLRDAAEYARSHGIVSMSYFNSGVHAPDGTLELSGETEQVFGELLSCDWVARPV